jgi:hypothetical protein
MIRASAVKALVFLLVMACPVLAETVEGTVVDATSGRRIYGVKVTLFTGRGDSETAVETTTDAQGDFRFENAKDGTYRIWYQRDGFLPSFETTAGIQEFQLIPGNGPTRPAACLMAGMCRWPGRWLKSGHPKGGCRPKR